MRLVILGATGGIGRILVSNALEQGHDVTAFVRSPEKVGQKDSRLRVIGGDLYNAQQMTAAIQNSEAVLSAFGPTTFRKTTLRRDFGRVLAQALQITGVQRVLHVSAAFLFPDAGIFPALLGNSLFRNVVHDDVDAEIELMQPNLAWTMLRPLRLTNGPAKNRYRVCGGHLPKGGITISRADVAAFMLKEVVQPQYMRQIVGLSN
jgi:putative NADH-flavin reductase